MQEKEKKKNDIMNNSSDITTQQDMRNLNQGKRKTDPNIQCFKVTPVQAPCFILQLSKMPLRMAARRFKPVTSDT